MMRTRKYFLALAFSLSMTATAKDEFTALEQQQICIATPGLFDHSSAFTVDFAGLRSSDYSFPLPVGKAQLLGGNEIEVVTAKGDAVKSMFAGTVRLSRHTQGQGNVIVVRHDNGLETVYSHNAENLVTVGDRVKAGQTIAIVGNDGKQGKLHFCIMVNGGRMNPEMILSVKNHRLLKNTLLCKKKETGDYVDLSIVDGGNHSGGKGQRKDDTKKAVNRNLMAQASADGMPGEPFADKNSFTLNLPNFDPGEWSYPLPDAKVISNYGRRGGRSHTGVDIKTKPNDEILAAFDGVVTQSGPYYAYGNVIRIKHHNGIETVYSHNSKNLVKVGDKVKAGQVIGLTGQTGRATTPHLHFECRVNGRHFDPARIFDHLNHSLKQEQVTFTKKQGTVVITAEKNYMAKGK